MAGDSIGLYEVGSILPRVHMAGNCSLRERS